MAQNHIQGATLGPTQEPGNSYQHLFGCIQNCRGSATAVQLPFPPPSNGQPLYQSSHAGSLLCAGSGKQIACSLVHKVKKKGTQGAVPDIVSEEPHLYMDMI